MHFVFLFFFKDFIYLFIRGTEKERDRDRDTGRGRIRLHAGSPMWDSIQGLQDHTPGCRQRQTAVPPGLPPMTLLSQMFTFISMEAVLTEVSNDLYSIQVDTHYISIFPFRYTVTSQSTHNCHYSVHSN